MIKRVTVMALVLAATLAASALAATDEGEDTRGRRREERSRAAWRDRAGRGTRMQMNRLIRQLDLSDDKAERVRDVFRAFGRGTQQHRTERTGQFRQLRDQLNEAIERKDEKAASAKLKQLSKTWTDQRASRNESLLEALSTVLNKGELAQAKLILQPRNVHRIGRMLMGLRSIPLGEAQEAKINGILDTAASKIEAVLKPAQHKQLKARMEDTGPARFRRQMGQRIRERIEQATQESEQDQADPAP